MKDSELKWLQEPARMVGRIITVVSIIAAGVILIANNLVGVMPDGWKDDVNLVVGIATAVVLLCSKIQAELTRNGFGKEGNGKDGVYSPWTVMNNPNMPPVVGTQPGATPQPEDPNLR